MRKILFVLNNLIVGGVEKVCWEIVSHLDKNKFQCDFLVAISAEQTQYYEPKLKELGCRIYKGGYIYSTRDKQRFLEIERRILRQNKYDVVHSHVDFLNIWTLRVAKKEKVPVRISHVHTTLSHDINIGLQQKIKYHFQQYLLVYFATHRVACSRQAALDYYGNSRTMLLFNGFDIDKFMKDTGVARNPWAIVTVGRIVDLKNPLFIVDIMKCLVDLNPQYTLCWIGDGNMREQCEAKIQKLGLENSVQMIGAETDIIPYLKKSGIALFPSKHEGLGIAIVEAQLAGCFTYYSDVVPEEADIGYGCALPLTDSPQKWAEKIHQSVERDIKSQFQVDIERASRYDVRQMKACIEKVYLGEK